MSLSYSNVARACGRGGVDNGKVAPAAFDLRPKERPFGKISVDWVECPYDVEERRTRSGSLARLRERGIARTQMVCFLEVRRIKRIDIAGVRMQVVSNSIGHSQNLDPRRCHCGVAGFSEIDDKLNYRIQLELAIIANLQEVILLTQV